MPEPRRIIEISLSLAGDATLLHEWLRARGIEDFVEASCDFLDEDSALATIEAHSAGEVELPTVLYSYDPLWVAALRQDLEERFGVALTVKERQLADELWQEAWQPDFVHFESKRFLVVRPGEAPAESARCVIELETGGDDLVFGSGQHATTQAMIVLLERHVPGAGESFLDVGTGTGILALVAFHLGYAHLLATDIDPDAIAAAQRNQVRNRASFHLIEGSLPDSGDAFDCIVCNILPPTLTYLLPALVLRLKPRGRLYLAGMHEANEDAVLERMGEWGLACEADERVRGWTAYCFRKADEPLEAPKGASALQG